MEENRYKDGLRNLFKNVRAAESMLMAIAGAEEDDKLAFKMRTMARAYNIVAGWVVDEIRDAEEEVKAMGVQCQ